MANTTPGLEQAKKRSRERHAEMIGDPDRAVQVAGLLLRELEPALWEGMHNVILHRQPFRRSEAEAGMSIAMSHLMQSMAFQLSGHGVNLGEATADLATATVVRLHASTLSIMADGGPDTIATVKNDNGVIVDVDPLGDFLKGGK